MPKSHIKISTTSARRTARRLPGRSGAGAGVLEQLARADLLGHAGGLVAVGAAVLELDRRIFPLPGQALHVVSAPAPHRSLDDHVVDAGLVQRALDLLARMPLELGPHERTPV